MLARRAAIAEGIDRGPRLTHLNSRVRVQRVEGVPDKSYDVVTNIEVVEHVQDDEAFVDHLGRIARELVFISTPNWTASRNLWPYHVREYNPAQMYELLSTIGVVTFFKGNSAGTEVHRVRR